MRDGIEDSRGGAPVGPGGVSWPHCPGTEGNARLWLRSSVFPPGIRKNHGGTSPRAEKPDQSPGEGQSTAAPAAEGDLPV